MASGWLGGLLGGAGSGALIGGLLGFGLPGVLIGAAIGGALGGGMGYWVDQLPVPEAPQIEKRSPNYGWDSARNAAGNETPVFVAYGVPQVHGAVVYQGGEAKTTKTTGAVEYVDPAEVMDFCMAWGEGPILDLYNVTADEVNLGDIAGAGARHYLGTAAQEPDERFATVRNRVEFSTPDWYTFDPDHPADTPAPKIFTFTPAEDGATAKLHAQWAAATRDGDRTKFAFFRLEYRPNGASLWTDAGVYEIRAAKSQLGVVDVQIPVGDPTGSDPLTVSVTEHWEQTITETADGYYTESTLVTQPQTVQKTTGVRYRTFAGGVAHELRVTYVRISAGGALVPEDSGFVSATLRFPDVEVVERLGAQAFRNTAYSALTLPRKGLQSSQPKLAARVVGRVVEVWTGAAFAERWSNNPIWCLRDLIRNTRYGLALPSVPYDGTSDAEWGGFRRAAAACDALVGTIQASAAVTTYAAGPPVTVTCAGWPTETDFAGYVLENQAGQTALIYRHDQADRKVYLVAAFATAPTSVTVKEQRFRLDLVLDAQRSAEEQVRQILTHCRGLWWEDAGSLRVAVEMPRASVGEIDVDAIVEGSFECWEERDDDLPDTLIARYIDPDQSFAKREVVLGTNADGGRVDEREWLGCLNVRQVQRLGWFVERIANLPRRCRFATPLSTIAYEPGDVVTVYHPVGGADYGYDLADPDAPVKTANGREVVILSISDDPQNDTRTHLCREYAAEAYSDAPGLNLPARLRDGRALGIPAAVTNLTVTFLGDLTDDGVFNPEIQAEWVQPYRGGVAYWRLYESRDEGATWRQERTVEIPVVVWKALGFGGPLWVKVIPVNAAGIAGLWDDAPVGIVTVTGDTTAPAIPANLRISFTDRLSVIWDANTEIDFSHYLCSIDDWVTSWRVMRANAEVLNPSGREFVFRVKALDRSTNASGEASIYCYLPQPAAPAANLLILQAVLNQVKVTVSDAFSKSLGHTGFYFRWSADAKATWKYPTPHAEQSATWTVSSADFAGEATLLIYVQYAEVDVFGPSDWSGDATVTATAPGDIEQGGTATRNVFTTSTSAPAEPGLGDLWYNPETKLLKRWNGSAWETWAGDHAIWETITGTGKPDDYATNNTLWRDTVDPTSGQGSDGDLWHNTTTDSVWHKVSGTWQIASDKTKTIIDGGLVTTGTIELQDGLDVTKAGITANTDGDTAIRFWAGETFANRTSAPFRVTQGGDAVIKGHAHFGNSTIGYLISVGKKLTSPTAASGDPSDSEFTTDGQLHVYRWLSGASDWAELAVIGLGTDNHIGYFDATSTQYWKGIKAKCTDAAALVGEDTAGGNGVYGRSDGAEGVLGVSVDDVGVGGTGLYGGQFFGNTENGGGNLHLGAVETDSNAPSHTAYAGTIYSQQTAGGTVSLWLNTTGSTTWVQIA